MAENRMRRIANRVAELSEFENLLRPSSSKRILLVQGESESGKSILLEQFDIIARECGTIKTGCADFNGGLLLSELLYSLCGELGQSIFPLYTKSISRQEAVHIDLSANLAESKFGDSNAIAINPVVQIPKGPALTASSAEQVGIFLQDLRNLRSIVLFIIDSYDQATQDAARWILMQLFPAIRTCPNLRIVIAGQSLPLPSNYKTTWGPYAVHKVLDQVTSIDDWHAFAMLYHPAFPRDYIELGCKGRLPARPSVFHSYIESIAKHLPPVPTKDGIK